MRTILIILIGLLTMTASSSNSEKEKPMEKCYCEYCGKQFPDVRQLVSAPCAYHPDGPNRGKHKLYQGRTTPPFTCKYCGNKFSSLMQMVTAPCAYHPKGTNKGQHSPTLSR